MATQRDPGAAGERTFLAWHRSGLSALVVAAIVLRGGRYVPAALAVTLAGIFELIAVHRLRSLHELDVLPSPLSPRVMRLVSATVAAVGFGAAISL